MSTHAARTEAPNQRRKITRKQAVEAYGAAGGVLAHAAAALDVHPNTLRATLTRAGVLDGPMSVQGIPPQFVPMYQVCRAKVGASEALRIIADHIERRA